MRNLCIVLFAIILSGCTDNLFKQSSIGKEYEVLLVSDDSLAKETIRNILETEVEGVPQFEPSFDVVSTNTIDKKNCLSRNIVVITTDSSNYTSTRIEYEKNVYASPQLIVQVMTPTAKTLKEDSAKVHQSLSQLIESAETERAIGDIKSNHNSKYEKAIQEKFSIGILVPKQMSAIKCGENFIWLSNNAATNMQNICIYQFGGTDIDMNHFISKRDSIMRKNIPGEHDNMYMKTVANSVTFKRMESGMRVKGLWEMTNDMMGGPFSARISIDKVHRKTIVAEAFIYAPETKKRNNMRRLEAALYTLSFK